MGIQIISQGGVAPWNTKILAPAMDALEGWFDIDTSAEHAAFNRAPGKSNADIIGSPVFTATGGRFTSRVNYLQTRIAEMLYPTVIVLGRAVNEVTSGDNGFFYASTNTGPSADPDVVSNGVAGMSLLVNNPNSVTMNGSLKNGTNQSLASSGVTQGAPHTEWGYRMGRISSVEITVANLTTGVSASAPITLPRLCTTNNIRVGSNFVGTAYNGLVEISSVAIYSRALTDTEVAGVVAMMRNRASRLGISA